MPTYQIEDGRTFQLTDIVIGVNLLSDPDILTLTITPTLGNVLLNGVPMVFGGTVTLAQIRNNELAYLSDTGLLDSTTFRLFDGSTNYDVGIELIVGKLGKILVIAKVSPQPLILTDVVPREIPPVLRNKIAHEVAARLLGRGDRVTDEKMSLENAAKFHEAKLDAIANINKMGGAMRQMRVR